MIAFDMFDKDESRVGEMKGKKKGKKKEAETSSTAKIASNLIMKSKWNTAADQVHAISGAGQVTNSSDRQFSNLMGNQPKRSHQKQSLQY